MFFGARLGRKKTRPKKHLLAIDLFFDKKNTKKVKNFNNLIDLFFDQVQKQNPNTIFLEWLNVLNRKKLTWLETVDQVYKLAKILKSYSKEGDRVLLVSENRPEWLISDLAIMLSGVITVRAYTSYTKDYYKYLIDDCEPSLIIVSNNEMLKKLNNTINEKTFIKKIITLDEVDRVVDDLSLNSKEKYLDYETITKNDLLEEDKIKNNTLKRTSPACIIYTSGTGGNPKGVILSHGGILNNLVGACEIMKPLFKIREIAWAIVSEVEDWLYPYRTDDTEPLWADKDGDDDSVVTYLKAQSDANNDRIDRLQSEMLYVTSKIHDINTMLKNLNIDEGQEGSKIIIEEGKETS